MMDKKNKFNLENPNDVEYLLSVIDDDMAINSEAEGDSDADHELPLSTFANTSSTRFSSPTLSDQSFLSNYVDEGEIREESANEEEATKFAEKPEKASPRIINEEERDETSSSDVSDEEAGPTTWARQSQTPKQYKDHGEDFSCLFGVSKNIKIDIFRPCNIFLSVLSNIFLQYIVEQSNLYTIQCNKVLDLTLDELKAYIGILVIMGFHSLRSMRLFWSCDQNFEVTRIKNVLTVKRFLKITRFLHLNNKTCMPKKREEDHDKLYKVKPFLEYVTKRFKLIFCPSRFLSVDESMIKFKGRSSLRQYMPMKPIKRGFKMWVIACGVTGYCLGIYLYEGAEKEGSMG
ncbi:piggyBac transposable element-derived protein 4-like [Anthonomus grandis grandis]|uniref:piggyBac transposable element-derived protein 4-like n=1 Tax=Anthonomus grandis grandis TaxID=2921223 RepID=UPI00216648FF|nr:piggyBac transposable element-derived protein 4-like [Anthonomus grandis grandis]